MVLIHIGQLLKEGSLTSTTKVAPAPDNNPNMLISDRNVHIQLGLDLVPMKLGMSTMSTARRRSDQLRLDMKVVLTLFYREDVVFLQSQDIQKSSLTCLWYYLMNSYSVGKFQQLKRDDYHDYYEYPVSIPRTFTFLTYSVSL